MDKDFNKKSILSIDYNISVIVIIAFIKALLFGLYAFYYPGCIFHFIGKNLFMFNGST